MISDPTLFFQRVIERVLTKSGNMGEALGGYDKNTSEDVLVQVMSDKLAGMFEKDELRKTDDSESIEKNMSSDLSAHYEELFERNATLAYALGACDCWGEVEDCGCCMGEGKPGWALPDKELFAYYVRPVISTLKRFSSPPDVRSKKKNQNQTKRREEMNRTSDDTEEDMNHRESNETSVCILDSTDKLQTEADLALHDDLTQTLYEDLPDVENERLTEKNATLQTWMEFFPFAMNKKFYVKYETWICDFNIGNGIVLDLTPELLKIKIHINKFDQFKVPETDLMIEVECCQEGSGNRAEVEVNGKKFTNNKVTINSKSRTREILMPITILGHKVDQIIMTREKTVKAKLILKSGDNEKILVLSQK